MALVYHANAAEPVTDAVQAILEIFSASQFPFQSIHLVSESSTSAEQNCDLANRLHQLQAGFYASGPAPLVVSHCATAEDVYRQVAEPLVAVCESGIRPDGHEWPWEALGLFELHADVAMIAGRIINSEGVVCAGGEIFGYGDLSNCLEYQRLPNDPGPYALLLKPRSVDAPNAAFFLARTDFLRQAQARIRDAASRRSLGIWLGAEASRQGLRIAATPLVAARARHRLDLQSVLTPAEQLQLREQFGNLFGVSRWYSQHASRSIPKAYEFARAV